MADTGVSRSEEVLLKSRPLPPGRLYHFNVLYNHARCSLSATDDTRQALAWTQRAVEWLQLQGLVNSYYHDRDCPRGQGLVQEMDRVLAGSQVTLLLLSPGFVKDCWPRYWQLPSFRDLFEGSGPPASGERLSGSSASAEGLSKKYSREDAVEDNFIPAYLLEDSIEKSSIPRYPWKESNEGGFFPKYSWKESNGSSFSPKYSWKAPGEENSCLGYAWEEPTRDTLWYDPAPSAGFETSSFSSVREQSHGLTAGCKKVVVVALDLDKGDLPEVTRGREVFFFTNNQQENEVTWRGLLKALVSAVPPGFVDDGVPLGCHKDRAVDEPTVPSVPSTKSQSTRSEAFIAQLSSVHSEYDVSAIPPTKESVGVWSCFFQHDQSSKNGETAAENRPHASKYPYTDEKSRTGNSKRSKPSSPQVDWMLELRRSRLSQGSWLARHAPRAVKYQQNSKLSLSTDRLLRPYVHRHGNRHRVLEKRRHKELSPLVAFPAHFSRPAFPNHSSRSGRREALHHFNAGHGSWISERVLEDEKQTQPPFEAERRETFPHFSSMSCKREADFNGIQKDKHATCYTANEEPNVTHTSATKDTPAESQQHVSNQMLSTTDTSILSQTLNKTYREAIEELAYALHKLKCTESSASAEEESLGGSFPAKGVSNPPLHQPAPSENSVLGGFHQESNVTPLIQNAEAQRATNQTRNQETRRDDFSTTENTVDCMFPATKTVSDNVIKTFRPLTANKEAHRELASGECIAVCPPALFVSNPVPNFEIKTTDDQVPSCETQTDSTQYQAERLSSLPAALSDKPSDETFVGCKLSISTAVPVFNVNISDDKMSTCQEETHTVLKQDPASRMSPSLIVRSEQEKFMFHLSIVPPENAMDVYEKHISSHQETGKTDACPLEHKTESTFASLSFASDYDAQKPESHTYSKMTSERQRQNQQTEEGTFSRSDCVEDAMPLLSTTPSGHHIVAENQLLPSENATSLSQKHGDKFLLGSCVAVPENVSGTEEKRMQNQISRPDICHKSQDSLSDTRGQEASHNTKEKTETSDQESRTEGNMLLTSTYEEMKSAFSTSALHKEPMPISNAQVKMEKGECTKVATVQNAETTIPDPQTDNRVYLKQMNRKIESSSETIKAYQEESMSALNEALEAENRIHSEEVHVQICVRSEVTTSGFTDENRSCGQIACRDTPPVHIHAERCAPAASVSPLEHDVKEDFTKIQSVSFQPVTDIPSHQEIHKAEPVEQISAVQETQSDNENESCASEEECLRHETENGTALLYTDPRVSVPVQSTIAQSCHADTETYTCHTTGKCNVMPTSTSPSRHRTECEGQVDYQATARDALFIGLQSVSAVSLQAQTVFTSTQANNYSSDATNKTASQPLGQEKRTGHSMMELLFDDPCLNKTTCDAETEAEDKFEEPRTLTIQSDFTLVSNVPGNKDLVNDAEKSSSDKPTTKKAFQAQSSADYSSKPLDKEARESPVRLPLMEHDSFQSDSCLDDSMSTSSTLIPSGNDSCLSESQFNDSISSTSTLVASEDDSFASTGHFDDSMLSSSTVIVDDHIETTNETDMSKSPRKETLVEKRAESETSVETAADEDHGRKIQEGEGKEHSPISRECCSLMKTTNHQEDKQKSHSAVTHDSANTNKVELFPHIALDSDALVVMEQTIARTNAEETKSDCSYITSIEDDHEHSYIDFMSSSHTTSDYETMSPRNLCDNSHESAFLSEGLSCFSETVPQMNTPSGLPNQTTPRSGAEISCEHLDSTKTDQWQDYVRKLDMPVETQRHSASAAEPFFQKGTSLPDLVDKNRVNRSAKVEEDAPVLLPTFENVAVQPAISQPPWQSPSFVESTVATRNFRKNVSTMTERRSEASTCSDSEAGNREVTESSEGATGLSDETDVGAAHAALRAENRWKYDGLDDEERRARRRLLPALYRVLCYALSRPEMPFF